MSSFSGDLLPESLKFPESQSVKIPGFASLQDYVFNRKARLRDLAATDEHQHSPVINHSMKFPVLFR